MGFHTTEVQLSPGLIRACKAFLFLIPISLMCIGSVCQAAVSNNLVGWWKFDDKTGSSAADSSGNAYNATLYGAPLWTTGHNGQAGGSLFFNGTNNYADAGNNVNLNGNQMSISLWVNSANNTQETYIGNMRWDGNKDADGKLHPNGFALNFNNGTFYWGNGKDLQSWQTRIHPPNNKWTLVTVVMDNNNLFYYEDGFLLATTPKSINGEVASGLYSFKIGRDPYYSIYFYNGALDNLRIYNRALTASEIALDFSQNYIPTTYYVDSIKGNDANSGLSGAPFQSIQQAANVVAPGDTVIVKDGVYTATGSSIVGNLSRGGTLSGWVTFKSEHKWGAHLNGSSNTLNSGFLIGPNLSYVKIQDFEIFGFFNAGITFPSGSNFSNHIEISGNNIHDIGRVCSDSAYGLDGIWVSPNSSSILIDKNIFHDIGRFAAGENGCATTTGYYQNHDHGVYVEGVLGITIVNNVFYNIKAGWGVHFWNGDNLVNPIVTTNALVANNTFAYANPYRDGQIILAAPGVTNSIIENNIFYSPRTAGILVSAGTYANVVVKNNIVYGGVINSGSVTGIVFSNNLEKTDPVVFKPYLYDFHLESSSPAIYAGVSVSQVTDDFDGNPRPAGPSNDIGAYEHTSTTYSLNVDTSGSGAFGQVFGTSAVSGNLINCGANYPPPPNNCSAVLNNGAAVKLTAKAANGSVFSGWSVTGSAPGTCVQAMNPCNFNISADTSVTAHFITIGVCGQANQTYKYSVTHFAGSLCAQGTAVPATLAFPSQGRSVTWTCLGSNGGGKSNCMAKHNIKPMQSRGLFR